MNQTFVTTLPAKTAHRLSFLQPGTLRQVALAAALVVAAGQAAALGLGRLNVQSALGEALRAEIEVTSLTPEEASTLRARVAAPDAFRASGLDYNAVMAATQVQLVQQSNGRAVLRIVSNRAVQEPFLDLLLDIRWSNGRLNREFTLLFDPPVGGAAAPSSTPTPAPEPVAPVLSAPAPAPAAQPVPAPQRAQVAAALAAGTAPAASSAPRAAAVPPTAAPRAPRPQVAPAADPAPRAARADGLTVRPGDSLSRLAARSRLEGVSLDQMMAALYRENPNAFIGGNLNLLRAGAHLRMPSLDLAQQVDAEEARRLIRAHSTNFEQVRQNLAAAAPRLPAQNPQAVKGAVQARVDEPKMGSSSGDRLTLSKAGPAAASAAPAASATQVAALSKNVEDLKKLSEAAKSPGVAPLTPAAAASAAPGVAASAVAAASDAVSGGMGAPAVAASTPAAPPPVASAAPAPAPTSADDSWLEALLSPVGAAVAVALVALVGYPVWRRARRPQFPVEHESVFGESRAPADSFFGVTGGQRVDTKDASTVAGSSMSYSLSQLDAHGDVDPVAEADVYLAYGRDLQAEEILKEALKAQPERFAIRVKLLEVYAKRRDVRGFEQLALQLYADSQGQGQDWQDAQALGREVDAANPLYQPGGAPRPVLDEQSPRPDPMNATTLPQATPVTEMQEPDNGPPSLIDLDLDLDVAASPALAPATDPSLVRTQSMPAQDAGRALDMGMDLDLSQPVVPAPQGAVPAPQTDFSSSRGMEFDLSDLGDLGAPTTQSDTRSLDTRALEPTVLIDLDTAAAGLDDVPTSRIGGDSLMDAMHDLSVDDADPMLRQIELADEFRQIGDVEGARDVLQEVLSRVTSGPVYERAKKLLDALR